MFEDFRSVLGVGFGSFFGGIFGELLAFQEALRRIVVSGSIFEASWGAQGSQVGLPNGMKIEEDKMKIGFLSLFASASLLTSIFYQFRLWKCTPRASKIKPALQGEHDF